MTNDLLAVFLQNAAISPAENMVYKNVVYNHRRIRIINYPFNYKNKGYTIQIGTFQKPIAEMILTWLNSVIINVPLALLLTSFIGYLLARRILDPVEEITQTARKITYMDLSARVKTQHSHEELKHLRDAFKAKLR